MDVSREDQVSKAIVWVFSFPGEDLSWIEWAGWKRVGRDLSLCVKALKPLNDDVLEMLQVRDTEFIASLPSTYRFGDLVVFDQDSRVEENVRIVVTFCEGQAQSQT